MRSSLGKLRGLPLSVVCALLRAASRCPQVRVSAGRKLAEGCGAALLAFSADARWLYASRPDGLRYRIERHAVPDLADAPAGSSDLSACFGPPRGIVLSDDG